MKKLSEIRDELADNHAENYFELNSDLEEEEINARDGIIHDFKRGFDSGVEEMKKRSEVLVEALNWIMPKVHQAHHEWDLSDCMKSSCIEYKKALEEYKTGLE